MDLSGFDAVVFAAAIVHRKDITDESLYNRVNAQLPYDLAQKAKAEGVKRFLFLSTAGVYKSNKTLPASIITADTPLEPDGPYGKSKLEGERLLKTLADDNFLLSICLKMQSHLFYLYRLHMQVFQNMYHIFFDTQLLFVQEY